MGSMHTPVHRVVLALRLALLVPLLYFAMQLVAAAFYPGYSFFDQDASTLGSPGSRFPAIFNGGAIIEGIVKCIVAWGFWRAFRQLGRSSRFAWLIPLVLVASGLASINAGIFPLPDPRHTMSPLAALNIGTILLPLLVPAAVWRWCETRSIKVYFIANIILFIALIPIISGLIQRLSVMAGVELYTYQQLLNQYHGLLQRITALLTLPPLAVGASLLADRLTRVVRPPLPVPAAATVTERSAWLSE